MNSNEIIFGLIETEEFIMNYQESREYIDRITREIPSVLGLDHMRELMKRLGNPQDDLKYVHVAGTNGKGSVIAFLYSALSIFIVTFNKPLFISMAFTIFS